jgi:hypothetical protein
MDEPPARFETSGVLVVEPELGKAPAQGRGIEGFVRDVVVSGDRERRREEIGGAMRRVRRATRTVDQASDGAQQRSPAGALQFPPDLV